ncbi:hypothetical protein JYT51_02225, partial [Candidatus Amoebophilus asiaticus]|nr:hypothetical protein [Candidatus Amoebophilus asiaticus]
MKTFKSRLLPIIVLTFSFLSTYSSDVKFEEFSKHWSETFEVNKDALLQITNKYGNIHITTWDKNIIEIEVDATVDVKSEKQAIRLLDVINITFKSSRNKIVVTTNFDGDLPRNPNKKLQIHYTVNMPKTN